jgi:hypothetical protein
VAPQVFRLVQWLVGELRKFVGWLVGLVRGSKLRSLALDLWSRAPFLIFSWVAFHGCSFKHTNGGRQWGLRAEGYRTPTGREVKRSTETESVGK